MSGKGGAACTPVAIYTLNRGRSSWCWLLLRAMESRGFITENSFFFSIVFFFFFEGGGGGASQWTPSERDRNSNMCNAVKGSVSFPKASTHFVAGSVESWGTLVPPLLLSLWPLACQICVSSGDGMFQQLRSPARGSCFPGGCFPCIESSGIFSGFSWIKKATLNNRDLLSSSHITWLTFIFFS